MVVCGGRGLVVIGEDAADEVGGFVAIAAVLDVGAVGLLDAVFVVAAGASVEVGRVVVTAAGQGDVEQCAAGVLTQHRVAGAGSDTLGGVHGDRVPEADVLP